MKYFSTRDDSLICSGAEAILNGIAPDGGLFLPQRQNRFDMTELSSLSDTALAVRILSFFFDEFTAEELTDFVTAACVRLFEHGDIAPLVKVGEAYMLELWHGPTAAFKDVALTLLPYLLTAARAKCGVTDEICILTATSGDTGSAALSGFAGVPGTRIVVFYPEGGVSPMQKRQMVCRPEANTAVCGVRGNFDAAQSGVKEIFSRGKAPAGVRFSSANSISIGRLVPQIIYYFKAYRDLLRRGAVRCGDPVDFTVPTGNFGDILAGYFAKQMGLPVGRLVCASNRNHILTDFFETGIYDRRREFYLTGSPSMDILVSGNLERLLCMTLGPEQTAAKMQELKENGSYRIGMAALTELRQSFAAGWAGEAKTAAEIRRVYEETHYLMDPHTAVASAVSRRFRRENEDRPMIVLSTASPYKFTGTVLSALSEEPAEDGFAAMDRLQELTGMPVPAALSGLKTKKICHPEVCAPEDMEAFVLRAATGEYSPVQ